MSTRFLIGDTRDVTATLPDASVDLILTSPPFLALRSYLPADHPDKWREIGSEPTPAAFIDTLLELTVEWDRVLAPHGTIAIELGDTYSGTGGGDAALSYRMAINGDRAKGGQAPRRITVGWPLAKCKAMIPELYRIALGYGINPLTGATSPAGQWRVRNVVTWCRPNPPVGALGDKFRPATSDLVIACRSATRWFDLDAVRTEPVSTYAPHSAGMVAKVDGDRTHGNATRSTGMVVAANPAGAPPLDYWVIPPGGYPGSHYAVYPPELCITPIEAMCPRQVCTTCGAPRRRITSPLNAIQDDPSERHDELTRAANSTSVNTWKRVTGETTSRSETVGWTDCGHDTWRPGVVLDPFVGSGTTLAVAQGHGRDSIGIDLDARNVDLAIQRVGMFLDVEDMRLAAPA